jgi:long-chain acyl-CoA synthetase
MQAINDNSNDNEKSPAARRRSFQRGVSLATWARLDGDRLAIRSADGNRSFRELDDNCNRLARALAECGVGVDDALALVCRNRPEFVEVMFAAERAGIRVIPIRPDLTPREFDYILGDSGAVAVIADTGISPRLTQLIGDKADMRAKVFIGADRSAPDSYHAMLESSDPRPFERGSIGMPMFYTSGTTGSPKGVYRREPLSRTTMAAIGERLKLSSKRDRALAPVAYCRSGLFNISVRLPLVCGVEVVVTEEPDPDKILQMIAEHGVTYAYLTPLHLHRLSQLPKSVRDKYDIGSLRHVLHTGAPCPVAIKREMIEWLGPIITEVYGGTEGGDIIISSQDWLTKAGSVGRAGDRVVIVDEHDDVVPADTIGRIFIAAPERGRFEYFNDPEKTRSAYRGDHYTMGDYGYLDSDGYLFITGRSSEIINSGALKIYPAEVDAVLLRHAAVEDAACVGVPNSELGEEVKAFVKLFPGQAADDRLAKELMALCHENLAPYKCPRQFAFIDGIPRLTTGKVLRETLREQYS